MATSTSYSTIYAFGDSLSDAGDANLFTTSTIGQLAGLSSEPVSPPYYNETYNQIGGGMITASVFSNGPVWVQDLATSLGLPSLAPGQLGATASTLLAVLVSEGGSTASAAPVVVAGLEAAQNAIGGNPYLQLVPGAKGGTDFAIGGSVTGATPFNNATASTLTDLSAQLANFKAEVPTPLANALYTVWGGSNDLLNILQAANFATLSGSGAVAADITQSVANEVAMVKTLVSLGAGTVLVVDVPDLGKTPEIMSLGATVVAAATAMAASFDTQLQTALSGTGFGTASIRFEDVASLIDNAVANPGSYGLTNTTNAVYTGNFTTYVPADLASTAVAVQNQYLFFDGLHPTSTGQSTVATAALGLVACFAAGTRIHTPRGWVRVEELQIGETVTLHSGETETVTWIGRRTIALRRHPRPETVQPVLIAANALATGVPARDLLLSPDHALLLEGHLIPAKALINGASIRQLDRDSVTYFHVELPRHAVLLAENAAVESYLDTGNRADFANGADAVTLFPDFATAGSAQALRARLGCAPFAAHGPAVEAARTAILARAAIPTTDDPDLHIRHDDSGAWICSRSAIAAELAPDPRDRRQLGVKIGLLILDGVAVPADHPALQLGWHDPEPDGRWTDGAALIPAALLRGARDVSITLVSSIRYRRALAA